MRKSNDRDKLSIRNIVERFVRTILKMYQEKNGILSFPMNIKILSQATAEFKKTNIKYEKNGSPSKFEEGFVVPEKDGFLIKYHKIAKTGEKFPNVRIRETICHELAHILFYNCRTGIPNLSRFRPPEYIYHDIARQLLLPTEIVRQEYFKGVLKGYNLITMLQEISRKSQTSIDLVIIRLTEDLSLVKDTMITVWKYKGDRTLTSDKRFEISDFKRDSKMCSELRKWLNNYRRKLICERVWEKVLAYLLKNKLDFYEPDPPLIIGKRLNVSFKAQSSHLYAQPNNLKLFKEIDTGIFNFLITQIFDTQTLSRLNTKRK